MVSSHASKASSATFADFLSLVRRRLALIALIFALVVIVTLAVTAFLPNWYLATAKIRVDKPDGKVELFQAQSSGGYDPYFLQDQLKIMQYEKILYPVIESLGLNAKLGASLGSTTPLTAATSYAYIIGKMLRIEAQRNSSIIEINVYARDPKLAASIANEIARVYSEDRIAEATAPQREGIAELKKQLDAQTKLVSGERDALEKLRKELNIPGIDLNARNSDMAVEQLRQMQLALISLRMEADAKKSRYESFKAIPPDKRITVINSETIPDPNIQNLLQAYYVADQNVTRLKGRLGEEHPDLKSAVELRAKSLQQLTDQLHGYEISLENTYKEAETKVTTLTQQLDRAGAAQILSAGDRMRPFDEASARLANDQNQLDGFRNLLKQKEIDFEQPKRTIEILNTAEPARSPSRPNWTLNTLLAGFFGCFLGLGVAVLLEYFDTSFRSVADVEGRLKLPVLGVIPVAAPTREDGADDPAEDEPYRVLHTNLNLTLKPGQASSFAIFSAGPGEGKSTTLHCLARLMAAAGEKVLLIDSDLRRPTQHQLAGCARQPGLSDLLVGRQPLEAVIKQGIVPNLDFIPSGGQAGFTLGLVHAPRLKELIAGLRSRYDRVVFDSPPIIGVSDASVLASAVDGAVLLIQYRRNPAAMVERARQILDGLKTPLLGVVLNQVPLNAGEDYGYYTNNYSYYSEGGGKKRRARSGPKAPAGGDGGGDRLELKE